MKAVQKLLTIEHFVDAVMVVFALASVGNIAEYMVGHGHNPVTAYGVGVALGFGLVAVSVLLARIPPSDRGTFRFMLIATVAVGLLSGAVQFLAYWEHGQTVITAGIQGFGFPLIGECLLAVAMSIYTEAQKRKRLSASDDAMNERINMFVNQSLDDVDLSKMTTYIERQVGLIVRNKIDNIVQQRIVQTSVDKPIVQTGVDIVQPKLSVDNDIVQSNPLSVVQNGQIEQVDIEQLNNLDDANVQRQDDVVQRQQRLLNILTEQMSAGASELHKLLGGDDICTRGTLYNDLQELAASGLVYNANRKWHIGQPAPVMNGHR